MIISEQEMEDILAMYDITECEGQETTSMYYLIERIQKEKKKMITKTEELEERIRLLEKGEKG